MMDLLQGLREMELSDLLRSPTTAETQAADAAKVPPEKLLSDTRLVFGASEVQGTYFAPVQADVRRPPDGGTGYGANGETAGTLSIQAIATALSAATMDPGGSDTPFVVQDDPPIEATIRTAAVFGAGQRDQYASDQDAITEQQSSILPSVTILGIRGTFPIDDWETIAASDQRVADQATADFNTVYAARSHVVGSIVMDGGTVAGTAPDLAGVASNVGTILARLGQPATTIVAAIADLPTLPNLLQRTLGSEEYASKRSLDAVAEIVASTDDAETIATAVWSASGRTLSGVTGGAAPSAAIASTDIYATAFVGGTARLCARVYLDGQDIKRADVSSIVYRVFLLDEQEPNSRTVVGFDVATTLDVAAVLFDTLQSDRQASDYNFRHTPPIVALLAASGPDVPYSPFPAVGSYLVEYTITPTVGEKIIVRFKATVV